MYLYILVVAFAGESLSYFFGTYGPPMRRKICDGVFANAKTGLHLRDRASLRLFVNLTL